MIPSWTKLPTELWLSIIGFTIIDESDDAWSRPHLEHAAGFVEVFPQLKALTAALANPYADLEVSPEGNISCMEGKCVKHLSIASYCPKVLLVDILSQHAATLPLLGLSITLYGDCKLTDGISAINTCRFSSSLRSLDLNLMDMDFVLRQDCVLALPNLVELRLRSPYGFPGLDEIRNPWRDNELRVFMDVNDRPRALGRALANLVSACPKLKTLACHMALDDDNIRKQYSAHQRQMMCGSAAPLHWPRGYNQVYGQMFAEGDPCREQYDHDAVAERENTAVGELLSSGTCPQIEFVSFMNFWTGVSVKDIRQRGIKVVRGGKDGRIGLLREDGRLKDWEVPNNS